MAKIYWIVAAPPFLIRPVRTKVLIEFILKYFMGLSRLSPRLFWTDDGSQAHLRIHVFVEGCSAVAVSCLLQIDGHAAVAVYAVMAVIDVLDLCMDLSFFAS